jgi:probable DNA metabolism protein
MTTIFYDGSFEGLLTVMFEIYARKLTDVNILPVGHHNKTMFNEELDVGTDNTRASRVLKKLTERIGKPGVQRLYAAYLAEITDPDNPIAGYMRFVFDNQYAVYDDYSNPYVLRISKIVGMVRREKHRMEAFIRFQKLSDGTFYATIDPDFNVLPLVLRHFKNRYADQKWIIYDSRRTYGAYYDLNQVTYITLDFLDGTNNENILSIYDSEESIYQTLWRAYFKSVNIKERSNYKLHLRHVPLRYWKNLTEKL